MEAWCVWTRGREEVVQEGVGGRGGGMGGVEEVVSFWRAWHPECLRCLSMLIGSDQRTQVEEGGEGEGERRGTKTSGRGVRGVREGG